MNEAMKKLAEHDKRFDQVDERLDKVDRRLDKVDGRLDLLDKQVDAIAHTVVDHTERLDRIEEKMATKDDMAKISTALDTLVSLAKKKDQELTMMSHGIMRISDEVEKIKPLVGLA